MERRPVRRPGQRGFLNFSDTFETVGKWIAVIMGTIAAGWSVRRRIAGDKLATSKDEGEADWLTHLQREREQALERERAACAEAIQRERATWELHLEDARKIARLELDNALMNEKMERLEKELALVKRLLVEARPELEKIVATGFGDLFSK